MMKNTNDINIEAIEMRGVPGQGFAWAVIYLTVAVVIVQCLLLGSAIGWAVSQGWLPTETMLILAALYLLDLILAGGKYGAKIGHAMINITPLEAMRKQSEKAWDCARQEIIAKMDMELLEGCRKYRLYNPKISLQTVCDFERALGAGKLREYLEEPQNLWAGGNLMYQYYVTSTFVSDALEMGQQRLSH